MLARIVDHVGALPATAGNLILPLINGERGVPGNAGGDDSAKSTVSLTTYIFDNDKTGKLFVGALEAGRRARAAVRVLVDAAGIRTRWRPNHHTLRRAEIRFAKFLPESVLAPWGSRP